MRVIVAIPAALDSPLANAINTFKMADGYARLGHEVLVVCREASSPSFSVADVRARLALSDNVDFEPTRSRLFWASLDRNELFASQVLRRANRFRPEFGYCRAFLPAVWLAHAAIPVAAETHQVSNNARVRALVKAARRSSHLRTVVTIAPILARRLVEMGTPEHKIIVRPSGVDLLLFTRPAQKPLRLSSSPHVVYSGHLYDYKGIPTILETARLLPEVHFTLVGGLPADVERVREIVRQRSLFNVELAGMKPYVDLPAILWDADVLLLPPTAKHSSAAWTSPVKLGEYLASGTPVVATRIPALESIVTDREVCFVAPDDAPALAGGVRQVLSDRAYAERLSAAAMARASELSYVARAQAILDRAFRQ